MCSRVKEPTYGFDSTSQLIACQAKTDPIHFHCCSLLLEEFHNFFKQALLLSQSRSVIKLTVKMFIISNSIIGSVGHINRRYLLL